MSGPLQAPTRAAVLELKKEQQVVNEAYIFLDEKRLLLASELLRQLRLYQQLNKDLERLHAQARDAMRSAVKFHGLDGLQVYPAATADNTVFKQSRRNFMGVTLVETGLTAEEGKDTEITIANPSAKAEYCRKLFREIVQSSAVLAGISGNLYRLLREYRLTERRARALENVILPEIEQNLREMSLHLEELDLEDAVRVHLRSGSRSLAS
jgi:V/A-type H+-transporting ATPase subunit D